MYVTTADAIDVVTGTRRRFRRQPRRRWSRRRKWWLAVRRATDSIGGDREPALVGFVRRDGDLQQIGRRVDRGPGWSVRRRSRVELLNAVFRGIGGGAGEVRKGAVGVRWRRSALRSAAVGVGQRGRRDTS